MKKKFIEAVFEGHYNGIKGFIEGFQSGTGKGYSFFFCSDHEVDSETFSELIKDWISLGNKIHHVLMEEELLESIKKALAKAGDTGLLNSAALKSAKPVREASFVFKFITYGRKYAEEIKEILSKLPEGVKITDYNPVEKIDKDAKGVELYAPVHDYVFQGKGTITGQADLIIPLRKTLDDHPLIEADKIRLLF